MTKRRVIDTNLIIRHLVQDHEKHAKAAARLFEVSDGGELVIVILPVVLAECVFVLESFYKHARADIAATLGALISSPGVAIDDKDIHLDALDRYRTTNVHFVDCLIAATCSAQDIPVATFDQDFRKFADVRLEVQ